MKETVIWGKVINLTRESICKVDFESFSNMTGISVERLKELETGTVVPSESEVEQISSLSEDGEAFKKLFNVMRDASIDDKTMNFVFNVVKKICKLIP